MATSDIVIVELDGEAARYTLTTGGGAPLRARSKRFADCASPPSTLERSTR